MAHHFIHLSDLHYRHDWPEQTAHVCRRLFIDIADQLANFPDAYLIFSGDLVQAGGEDKLYETFEAHFSDTLDKLGIPKARRVCVPGNHDISRAALKPKVTLQEGALSGMTDEEVFNNNLRQLTEMFFGPTFANYKECESKVAHYTCCANNVGGAGWELPNGIGVYCLNTSLCSFGGLEDTKGKKINDKGRLLIDTDRYIAGSATTPTRSLESW